MSSSAPKAAVTSLTDLPSQDAKWLKLQRATYTTASGATRAWEIASRKTTSASGIDAVTIGNILYHPASSKKAPSTILVLQFRPPVNATTVEWPAGLIDASETPEQAAVRELREETGYTGGKILSVSPAVAADPGMSSANISLVMVEMQLSEAEAEKGMPEQQLDEEEEIVRVEVPLSELHARLEGFAKEGYVVAAKLWHWAAGVQFALEHPQIFGR